MLRETDDQDPYNLTIKGSEDQSPNNWRHLWEANKKSRRRAARAWLQRFSSSPPLPRILSTPLSSFDLPEAVAMSNNPVHQTHEYQFLHWRQKMERKQEEKVREMQELQAHAERMQRENDQLWT